MWLLNLARVVKIKVIPYIRIPKAASNHFVDCYYYQTVQAGKISQQFHHSFLEQPKSIQKGKKIPRNSAKSQPKDNFTEIQLS